MSHPQGVGVNDFVSMVQSQLTSDKNINICVTSFMYEPLILYDDNLCVIENQGT